MLKAKTTAPVCKKFPLPQKVSAVSTPWKEDNKLASVTKQDKGVELFNCAKIVLSFI